MTHSLAIYDFFQIRRNAFNAIVKFHSIMGVLVGRTMASEHSRQFLECSVTDKPYEVKKHISGFKFWRLTELVAGKTPKFSGRFKLYPSTGSG
ncbi:MAG: hypothetical protein COV46_04840 [Deltaproteobacteria bacterium CG11_big_fil_rev_8_21_14_0_20_49_13]|nr:MAG: hypothetical protein COV46_04840 [Deltaproteobacteria bacterium CG11_big_fil_rev_8_21_14_0_20_49_13]